MGTTSTTTYGTTTIEIVFDTASTTQAVLSVGYSITFFIGIIIGMIFFKMSYKFFRGYL